MAESAGGRVLRTDDRHDAAALEQRSQIWCDRPEGLLDLSSRAGAEIQPKDPGRIAVEDAKVIDVVVLRDEDHLHQLGVAELMRSGADFIPS